VLLYLLNRDGNLVVGIEEALIEPAEELADRISNLNGHDFNERF
jgi:hypothetical protein